MSAIRLPGRPRPVKNQRIRRGAGEAALPYAMVAPLLVFIGALALYPTIKTAYAAFVHNDALTRRRTSPGSRTSRTSSTTRRCATAW